MNIFDGANGRIKGTSSLHDGPIDLILKIIIKRGDKKKSSSLWIGMCDLNIFQLQV